MERVLAIIQKKPPTFLLVTVVYLCVISLLKWQLKLPLEAMWFVVGGLVGLYFLDGAEAFFRLSPSPFRSIVFVGLFAVVSFFVVTSSGSLLATGLVLTLYISLILAQVGEWQVTGNLGSWYRLVATPVSVRVQQALLGVFIVLFLIETYLFVR